MHVKAKFRCEAVVDTNTGSESKSRTVKFRAAYGSQGENASYAKYTPNGELSIQIDESTPAHDFFQPGKSYYLTIEETPAS